MDCKHDKGFWTDMEGNKRCRDCDEAVSEGNLKLIDW